MALACFIVVPNRAKIRSNLAKLPFLRSFVLIARSSVLELPASLIEPGLRSSIVCSAARFASFPPGTGARMRESLVTLLINSFRRHSRHFQSARAIRIGTSDGGEKMESFALHYHRKPGISVAIMSTVLLLQPIEPATLSGHSVRHAMHLPYQIVVYPKPSTTSSFVSPPCCLVSGPFDLLPSPPLLSSRPSPNRPRGCPITYHTPQTDR